MLTQISIKTKLASEEPKQMGIDWRVSMYLDTLRLGWSRCLRVFTSALSATLARGIDFHHIGHVVQSSLARVGDGEVEKKRGSLAISR